MKSVFTEEEFSDIQKYNETENEIAKITNEINQLRSNVKDPEQIIKEKLKAYGKKYKELKDLEDFLYHKKYKLHYEKDAEEIVEIQKKRDKVESDQHDLVIEALTLEMNMYLEIYGEIEYSYSDRDGGSFHTAMGTKWTDNINFTEEEFNNALSRVNCKSHTTSYDIPEHGIGGGIDCTRYIVTLKRPKLYDNT